MNFYAISDLHLSLLAPYEPWRDPVPKLHKPMDIFGRAWRNYYWRLACQWQACVREEDVVLLPGDLSWAMTLAEARHDLAFLGSLPGRKILVRGNHDYWWSSLSQVRAALPANCHALQNDALAIGGYAVCGSRLWLSPQSTEYKEADDAKIYARELLRLELSLAAAAKTGLPILVMTHYPPLFRAGQESEAMRLICRYPVIACVYGHIHGEHSRAYEGYYRGIPVHNYSAERLRMRPRRLLSVKEGIMC